MHIPFITGFPGFISRQIIVELIQQKKVEIIYAVVLPTQLKIAKEVAKELVRDSPNVNIVIIEGDIGYHFTKHRSVGRNFTISP